MWYLLNSGPGLGQTQKCGTVFIKFRSCPWTDTKMWYLLNSGPGLGQTQTCGIY
jgi:hypothetical protein